MARCADGRRLRRRHFIGAVGVAPTRPARRQRPRRIDAVGVGRYTPRAAFDVCAAAFGVLAAVGVAR